MTCKCQNCSGEILGLTEDAGRTVVCPHCNKETVLNIPSGDSPKYFVWQNDQQQGPFSEETIQRMLAEEQISLDTLLCPEGGGSDWMSAKELFFRSPPQENPAALSAVSAAQAIKNLTSDSVVKVTDDGSRLEIRLLSGAHLRIKCLRLYNKIDLARLNAKKAEAIRMLQGVSTGLGTIGSIGWVVAASAVIGAAEAAMSAGATSVGARLLDEAMQEERKLREEGIFLPVCKILEIEHPSPGLWRVGFTWKEEREVEGVFTTKKEVTTLHSGRVALLL